MATIAIKKEINGVASYIRNNGELFTIFSPIILNSSGTRVLLRDAIGDFDFSSTDSITINDMSYNGHTAKEIVAKLRDEVFLNAGGAASTTDAGDLITGTLDDDRLSGNVMFMEIAATYAAIDPGTRKRLIYVLADETNNDDISLYVHNGTVLKSIHLTEQLES